MNAEKIDDAELSSRETPELKRAVAEELMLEEMDLPIDYFIDWVKDKGIKKNEPTE